MRGRRPLGTRFARIAATLPLLWAVSPGDASAVTLTSGNATIQYLVEPTTINGKQVDGFVGLQSNVTSSDGSSLVIPTITQSQWWIRVDDGAELSLAGHTTTGPALTSGRSDQVTATFADPLNRYSVDFTGTLYGDPNPSPFLGGLSEQLLITGKTGDAPMSLYLFTYTDFDFFQPTRETLGFDGVSFIQTELFDFPPCNASLESCRPFSPPTTYLVEISGVGTATGSDVVGHEMGTFPVLRSKLNDGSPTDLDSSAVVSDQTQQDLVFATQYRFDIPANTEFGFGFLLTRLPQTLEVPEPSSASLIGLGLLGLIAGRHRRLAT